MSSSDRFHISCPGCGSQVAVSMAHVGKKGRCPSCKTVFPISAPAAPEPVVADLVPMGAPGLQPLGAAGLQPISQPAAWPAQQPAWQGASLPNPYGQSASPSPFGAAAPSAYGQPTSPFGQTASAGDDDLRLAPDANPYTAPAAPLSSYNFAPAKPQTHSGDGEINGSLWGGIGMMVLAIVWFVGGLFFDIIFFYPPILFIIGLIAFVRGLVNLGNNN